MHSRHLTCLALLATLPFAAPAIAQPPIPAFYTGVGKMTPQGKLGHVIAKEPVATPVPGAVAWRIAYISSDMADKSTISTGLVIVPKDKAPDCGRPVMSWAHGTTGTDQSCGSLQVVDPAVPLNDYSLPSGNSWMDYGVPAIAEFIKAGYVVVSTDYQGLGGGGKHQYQLAETQARDAINAIRAAGAMTESGAGRKAVVQGWSQGAAAAIAAVSNPDDLARKGTAFDGIELAGAVAMALPDFRTLAPAGPVTEDSGKAMLAGVAKSCANSVGNYNHLVMTLRGTRAAYPDRLKLTDLFTEDGAKFVDQVMGNKCVHASSDRGNIRLRVLRTGGAEALNKAQIFPAHCLVLPSQQKCNPRLISSQCRRLGKAT